MIGKETRETKIINDYYRIRLEQYIEKLNAGMTDEEESEFYSRIMEIAGLIDYCDISTEINNTELTRKIRELHYKKRNKELEKYIKNIFS